MNRIIHKGFFREMCRQLRTKGLVATFILLGYNLVVLASFSIQDHVKADLTHLHQSLMLAPTYIFLYVATPILAFGAYRWLNRRSQSDFYHAIPLTRLQLYASTTAAILLWLFIPITTHTVMQVLLYMLFGMPFNYLLQLCVYLNVLIASLSILGAISIGVSVSGSGFVGFFTSVVILFYPRAFLMLLAVLTEIHSGISVPFSLQPFFINPSFNIAATPIHTLFYVPDLGNVLAMLYSLAYGLLLLTLGGIAFHRRKSEAAEIPYTSRTLQTLVRIAIGSAPLIGFSALLSVIYEELDSIENVSVLIPIGVTAVLFSFVFYCLYELISAKRWKKVVKAMPFYPVCLVLAAIVAILPAAVRKPMKLQTIAESDVTGYRFVGDESSPLIPRRLALSLNYADVIATKHTFRDRQSISQFVSNSDLDLADNAGGALGRVQFKGVNQVRNVSLNRSTQLEYCLKDASFREEYYAYPKGNIYYLCPGLTNAEAKEIGELFRKDYEALSEADREQLMSARKNTNRYYYVYAESIAPKTTDLSITLYGCLGTKNYREKFVINELTPNAAKRYLELLNARNGEAVRKALVDFVNWMETGNDLSGSNSESYFYLGNSNYAMSFWRLCDEVEVNGTWKQYRTPMSAHEKEYAILKALSEAPLCTEADQCVTVRAEILTKDLRYKTVTVGFLIPEEYREDLLAWIAQGDFNDDFVGSFDFGSL